MTSDSGESSSDDGSRRPDYPKAYLDDELAAEEVRQLSLLTLRTFRQKRHATRNLNFTHLTPNYVKRTQKVGPNDLPVTLAWGFPDAEAWKLFLLPLESAVSPEELNLYVTFPLESVQMELLGSLR